MSIKNVELFYSEISKNESLREKINSIEELKKDKLDLVSSKDIIEKYLIPVAKENGFDFDFNDLKKFSDEKSKLNLEDLDNVSGGAENLNLKGCGCVIVGGGSGNCSCCFGGAGAGSKTTCGCPMVGGGTK